MAAIAFGLDRRPGKHITRRVNWDAVLAFALAIELWVVIGSGTRLALVALA